MNSQYHRFTAAPSTPLRLTLAIAAVAVAAAFGAAGARAQAHGHGHGQNHGSHDAAPARQVAAADTQAHGDAHGHDHGAAGGKLVLDDGRKWATDAPLRSGMERMRSIVARRLDAAHHGKLSHAQYAALAGRVETEVAGIVANCKLEPKADAMLHLVIAEIGAGTDAMAGKTPALPRAQGLLKVATALNDYAEHFDHPGFKPIAELQH